jgi:hypothetical protein
LSDEPDGGVPGSMSDASAATTAVTEIVLASGDRYRVSGDLREVERIVLSAARGAIMEFAWVTATTGEPLAINPDCVALLRAA